MHREVKASCRCVVTSLFLAFERPRALFRRFRLHCRHRSCTLTLTHIQHHTHTLTRTRTRTCTCTRTRRDGRVRGLRFSQTEKNKKHNCLRLPVQHTARLQEVHQVRHVQRDCNRTRLDSPDENRVCSSHARRSYHPLHRHCAHYCQHAPSRGNSTTELSPMIKPTLMQHAVSSSWRYLLLLASLDFGESPVPVWTKEKRLFAPRLRSAHVTISYAIARCVANALIYGSKSIARYPVR